jgi:hypothetical protein
VRFVRRFGVKHPENPMSATRHKHFKKICAQGHFTACKKVAFLIYQKVKAGLKPSRSPEITSLFERWFTPTNSMRVLFCFDFLWREPAQYVVAMGAKYHKIQFVISQKKQMN